MQELFTTATKHAPSNSNQIFIGLHLMLPWLQLPMLSVVLCVKSAPDGYTTMDICLCRSDLPASVSHKRGRCLQGLGPYLFCPKQISHEVSIKSAPQSSTQHLGVTFHARSTNRTRALASHIGQLTPPGPLPLQSHARPHCPDVACICCELRIRSSQLVRLPSPDVLYNRSQTRKRYRSTHQTFL